eukprot:3595448-Rhodomonas_salina.1
MHQCEICAMLKGVRVDYGVQKCQPQPCCRWLVALPPLARRHWHTARSMQEILMQYHPASVHLALHQCVPLLRYARAAHALCATAIQTLTCQLSPSGTVGDERSWGGGVLMVWGLDGPGGGCSGLGCAEWERGRW